LPKPWLRDFKFLAEQGWLDQTLVILISNITCSYLFTKIHACYAPCYKWKLTVSAVSIIYTIQEVLAAE